MRKRDSISVAKGKAAVLSVSLLALGGAAFGAGAQHPEPQSYTWSAELVAFDQASNTVTVQARLVETADELDVRAGERAMLTWSGISTAAGVRAIEPGTKSSYDRMTMPVELVGTVHEGRYVSFKVPIPAADAAAIARLSPGDWVTATSPLQAQQPTEAVSAIRPYNDVG